MSGGNVAKALNFHFAIFEFLSWKGLLRAENPSGQVALWPGHAFAFVEVRGRSKLGR